MNIFQIIIVFAIVLVGVLIVHVLSNIIDNVKNLETKKEPCKLHDWYTIIDQEGKDLGMVCIECKKTPVDIQREFEQ